MEHTTVGGARWVRLSFLCFLLLHLAAATFQQRLRAARPWDSLCSNFFCWTTYDDFDCVEWRNVFHPKGVVVEGGGQEKGEEEVGLSYRVCQKGEKNNNNVLTVNKKKKPPSREETFIVSCPKMQRP